MNAFPIFQKLITAILKSISECQDILKSPGKGEALISCDVIFRFSCYSVFNSSEDYRELNMAKSKLLVIKIKRNRRFSFAN